MRYDPSEGSVRMEKPANPSHAGDPSEAAYAALAPLISE
jgi:hypothetical protein